MVVMKAMGMESDQEVIQMVGRDPRYSFLLLPSIEVINVILVMSNVMMLLSPINYERLEKQGTCTILYMLLCSFLAYAQ